MKPAWRKPRKPSDAVDAKPPRYWPGDPVVTATGEAARVMFSRADGTVFLELSDGRKVALHEEYLTFAPGFSPTRR